MATTKRTRRKKETAKILDAVSNLQPNMIVEEIGNLQNTLQSTLAGLSAQISSKVEKMRNVEEAISVKQDELEELYNIEKEAMSLEDVRAKRLAEDEDWAKKVDRRLIEWQEELEEQDKKFKRLEEEHAYSHQRRLAQAEQNFNATAAERRRAESFRAEDMEKQWQEREEVIASKEQEFAELKAQVDSFDEKLKAETAKAEAIATNRLKKDYEHQIDMLEKDKESEKTLSSIKICALDDVVQSLNDQINDLQDQLTASRSDAKEVTNAALQSASGHQTMQALQRVVDVSGQPTKGK